VATGSDPGKAAISSVEIPPRPKARSPQEARSAREDHRAWIEAQVQFGRYAVSIYQVRIPAKVITDSTSS